MAIATQILDKKISPFPFKTEFRPRDITFWQDIPPASVPKPLPTMYDLPSENPEEPGVPDQFHDFQADLLSESYHLNDYSAEQILTAADLNLYFDSKNPQWYKRPDWYAVVGVPNLYHGQDLRSSYVVWDEGVAPFIVVELLSPSTEAEDLGRTKENSGEPPPKWKVYEQILKIPYYILFDKRTDKLQGFRLINGKYQPLDLVKERLWIPELKVGLGLWQGIYQGSKRQWLRWYDATGHWIPTPLEHEQQAKEQERFAKEQERRAKEQERFAKEQERRAKERLAAKLRELGIDPDTI